MTMKITLKDDYESEIKLCIIIGWKALNETGDIMNAPCQFV